METIHYRGFDISIEQDILAENPREMFNTLSKISYRSRRYILGDEEESNIEYADDFIIRVLGEDVYDELDPTLEGIFEKYDLLMDMAEEKYDHRLRKVHIALNNLASIHLEGIGSDPEAERDFEEAARTKELLKMLEESLTPQHKKSIPIVSLLLNRRDDELMLVDIKYNKLALDHAKANYVYEELSLQQDGWAVGYISLKDAAKKWGTDPKDGWDAPVKLSNGRTDTLRSIAQSQLCEEIKEFLAWADGNVWGYTIADQSGKDVSSCWGFYCEPGSEGWEHMLRTAREHIESILEEYDQAK